MVEIGLKLRSFAELEQLVDDERLQQRPGPARPRLREPVGALATQPRCETAVNQVNFGQPRKPLQLLDLLQPSNVPLGNRAQVIREPELPRAAARSRSTSSDRKDPPSSA